MIILDDCNTDNVIPLPNVKGKTLAKDIECMKKHAGKEQVADEEELRAWDGEFMKVDTGTLYFLLNVSPPATLCSTLILSTSFLRHHIIWLSLALVVLDIQLFGYQRATGRWQT